MRVLPLLALAAAAVGLPAAGPAVAATPRPAAAQATSRPLPVRVVVVTMFEIGKDTGDAPGEFQFWKERRRLDLRIPFPQSWHDLYYDPATQTLAMVTGVGSVRSASAVTALGLDPRFDLKKAYWLVAGIAGIDPADASIGSAAWARYIVDGDLAHEIDAREMPASWSSGRFPLDTQGPDDPAPPRPRGELFALDAGLADWAYRLTKDTPLPDDPAIARERARYTGYPMAQRAPFVLQGDQLSAITFWHGKLLNAWANDWVKHWTSGKGNFVTSAEEETGTAQALAYLDKAGRVDARRLMVLRGGSNYTMPPPGISPADYLKRENAGYSGLRASLESVYRVGSRVVDELTAHWDRYADAPPR